MPEKILRPLKKSEIDNPKSRGEFFDLFEESLNQEIDQLRQENPELAKLEKELQEKEAKEHPSKKTP